MEKRNREILDEVDQYYSAKLIKYGISPQGVDWNGKDSQILRFRQLCKIITEAKFSINDIGCGYGALYDFLRAQYSQFEYYGVDISNEMINACKLRISGNSTVHFLKSDRPEKIADYSVASGIFNVRMGNESGEWEDYLKHTLDILDKSSRHGFAFNLLTNYSDSDKRRDNLYYADPTNLFKLCKDRYSRNVALLHDYGLYEFTILVRKAS